MCVCVCVCVLVYVLNVCIIYYFNLTTHSTLKLVLEVFCNRNRHVCALLSGVYKIFRAANKYIAHEMTVLGFFY